MREKPKASSITIIKNLKIKPSSTHQMQNTHMKDNQQKDKKNNPQNKL